MSEATLNEGQEAAHSAFDFILYVCFFLGFVKLNKFLI